MSPPRVVIPFETLSPVLLNQLSPRADNNRAMGRNREGEDSEKVNAPVQAGERSNSPFSGRFRFGNSIAARIWFVFGGLIAIMLVATGILMNSMGSVDRDITQITDVEEVITAAAYEMEINVNDTGMAILQYLDVPDTEFRIRVAKDQADFERFQAEFDRLASTAEERELAAEVADLYTEFKALGVLLMAEKDRQEELFRIVGHSFGQVDAFVDEELQPIIETQTIAGLEKLVLTVEMETEAAEVAAWLGNYLRVGNEEYRMRIADDTSDFWEALSLFRDLGATAAEEAVLIDLEYVFDIASNFTIEILAVNDSIQVGLARFTDLREQLGSLLDEKIQLLTEQALTASRAEAHASVDWMQWVIRAMIGLSVVAGGLAILALTRGIIGPVRRLVAGAEEIGGGKLAYRIEKQS